MPMCGGSNLATSGLALLENPDVTDSVLELCRVPTEPLLWVWSQGTEQSLGTVMHGWREARLTVRTVRGRKMLNEGRLFDEFAAALQFPSYFGENWSALDECLTDLEWLPPEAGYVLVFTEPMRVLEDAPAVLPTLVKSLASACEEWRTPVALGEWWDRPAVPFQVVLSSPAKDESYVLKRWREAGAMVQRLRP
jgi:RNAse (barnase) inhibitor barstar